MGKKACPRWAGHGTALGFSNHHREVARWPVSAASAALSPGLIIVNAWYGKFVNDKSRKNEKVKVIDVTVPLQCLVKDSKLILTEASKVQHQATSATCSQDPDPCDKDSQASVPAKSSWCLYVLCLLGSRKRLWAQKSSVAVAVSGRLQAGLRRAQGPVWHHPSKL